MVKLWYFCGVLNFCTVIPCFNHSNSVGSVARRAREYCPVLIVDDGSIALLPEVPGCSILRREQNGGKGAALQSGFQYAVEQGFTHVITFDADGQHFAEDIPKFLAAARARPDVLIVGVRDFAASECPPARRWANGVSNFWFRVETGLALRDSQCGFRCYPLELVRQLKTSSGRFAFELEFMVRAAWGRTPIIPLPIKCIYGAEQVSRSHFRPVRDFAHIALMSLGLALQSRWK